MGINAHSTPALCSMRQFLHHGARRGRDRKSFFAVAESPNGVDNFRFLELPGLSA